jgi:hypothetical protein
MRRLSFIQQCVLGTVVAAVVAHGGKVALAQDDFSDYREVPIVTGQAIYRVRSILQEGATDLRRIILFGDSQESSPGGAGRVYLPRLQRKMRDRFQYVGETRLMGFSSQGSGDPPAGWLSVVGIAPNGPLPTSIDSERIPPGLSVRANVALSMGGIQEHGAAFTLVHDGTLTADTFSIPGTMIDPSHEIVAEVFVYDTPDGGGVGFIERPTNDPLAWAPETGSGVIELAPRPESPGILVGRSAPLSLNGRTYHRIEVVGTDPDRPVQVAGVRFVDVEKHVGITVRSFSRGGYTARNLPLDHGLSGELLRATRPHIAVVQYGANDVMETSAAGFEARMWSVVAFIREAMNDPCFPIVLVSDPYRWVPVELRPRQDQYPGALAAIAEADPAIVAVNMRRLLEERYGWGPKYHPHLSGLVHLTPLAQVMVADRLAEILLNERGTGCDGDFNSDGTVNAQDFGLLLASLDTAGSPPHPCSLAADLDGDGLVTSVDLGLLLLLWGDCPLEFAIDGPVVGSAGEN